MNQHGKLDTVAPFVGHLSFIDHVKNVLEMPKVTAHLMILPAISVEGHTVETLTQEVQTKMVEGLAQLQQRVLQTDSVND